MERRGMGYVFTNDELMQNLRGRIADRLTNCVQKGIPDAVCDVIATCPDLIEKGVEWLNCHVATRRAYVVCGNYVARLEPDVSARVCETGVLVYNLDEFIASYWPLRQYDYKTYVTLGRELWLFNYDIHEVRDVETYVELLRELKSWLRRAEGLRAPTPEVRRATIKAIDKMLEKARYHAPWLFR